MSEIFLFVTDSPNLSVNLLKDALGLHLYLVMQVIS